jgi:hypothetical protein
MGFQGSFSPQGTDIGGPPQGADMMTLEAAILRLTHATPSGGACRIGGAAFKVFYCSDLWEWEYQGETYWDSQDLAEALAPAISAGLPFVEAMPLGHEAGVYGGRRKARRTSEPSHRSEVARRLQVKQPCSPPLCESSSADPCLLHAEKTH